jgi:hypothetical protein
MNCVLLWLLGVLGSCRMNVFIMTWGVFATVHLPVAVPVPFPFNSGASPLILACQIADATGYWFAAQPV